MVRTAIGRILPSKRGNSCLVRSARRDSHFHTTVPHEYPRVFMAFLPSLSAKELHHYHKVVTRSMEVRSHFDVLAWLQGDMQRYLPHDIMVAAWGDFSEGGVHLDIISPLTGMRSSKANSAALSPLLLDLYSRWMEFGKKPFVLNAGDSGFPLDDQGLKNTVGPTLQTMRSAMVHGIADARASHDCLYVVFNSKEELSEQARGAMAVALPYIDTALRQVTHLPHQAKVQAPAATGPAPDEAPGIVIAQSFLLPKDYMLSERESEVLHWVAMGKTNPEIASILHISAFTVKNHMQRVFKKLDVSNRAQAVSKLMPLASHVQN